MRIRTSYLNSSLTKKQQKDIQTQLKSGEIQFLYVSPERFDNANFMRLLQQLDIHLVVFDEAHCISNWVHDFISYNLEVIHKVFSLKQDFSIVALTATAKIDIQKDIMDHLNIDKHYEIKTSTKRRNLIFQVNPTYQRQKFVLEYVKDHQKEAGIIYCSTRKQ